MILKNDKTNKQLAMGNWQGIKLLIAYCLLPIALLTSGCYSFKDIGSIPKEVKTFRVNYIENKARYINPQLSPQLSDKLRQKIMGQTRLVGVQTEDAHYDISGQVTGYNVTTSAISSGGANNQQQAAGQRLTVTVHLNFKNNLDPSKNFEADVSRNFDYSAQLTITQAEAQLNETIIKNMVDEIFNRIFSNW
jgi:outer membrane lipopolysaccharide assembly protein LptE/RlpB